MPEAQDRSRRPVSILSGEPFAVHRHEAHRYGRAGVAALVVHTVVIVAALVGFSRLPQPPPSSEIVIPTTLVFRVEAGPGGGGGGGGDATPEPPPVLEIAGDDVAEQAVDPLPEEPLVYAPEVADSETEVDAPFLPAAPDADSREGVIDEGMPLSEDAGPGTGGGAGSGDGTGRGAGAGSGVGEGEGEGFGGGAYRLGTGVEPPSIVRSVDPDYTNDALQRKIEGEVVLEVVILQDGRVGQIRVAQGLDPGLDLNAIAAVRQWQFRPGLSQGQPVAVIVEIVVEFRLY